MHFIKHFIERESKFPRKFIQKKIAVQTFVEACNNSDSLKKKKKRITVKPCVHRTNKGKPKEKYKLVEH